MKKPFELYLLWFWLAFLGLNGIIGGSLLMAKPDGSLLGMNLSWLENTPFPNFRFPGLCLFLLNGALPIVALWGLIWQKKVQTFQFLNILKDKHWSWTFTLYSGIVTITWIIVQQLISNYFVLQPIITAIGLVNLTLALLPRVQKRYTTSSE
ncbi:MAG: hypothetical protein JW798_11925 [Prolixibacteraceae bacterium]|nr:hypothetical protein [Prolixibacteraceae bacterium]